MCYQEHVMGVNRHEVKGRISRINKVKGKISETAGKVVGNKKLQVRGNVHQYCSATGTRRRLYGALPRHVASPNFTIARGEDIMFNVIGRMSRRKAIMAVVVEAEERIPRTKDVAGLITKEHVADSVAESIKPYAASDAIL
jgi:uncharacterized protein YjbJ (UPF0337 family)